MFRSSRPDYIETNSDARPEFSGAHIVPVFQTGLH